jgi:methionine biosynthesis protein MetW
VNARDYYDRYWSPDGFHPTGRATPELARLFEGWVPAGARCLDVGCGDGRTSGGWLLNRGCSYEGVDVSANAIEEARTLGLNAQRIDDASRLPFADASFDVVVCVEVLEHLFAPLDAVREMARVLRPGGLLIVTVPNVAYWRRRVDMVLLGRWNPVGDDRAVSEPWRDPHIRFFNPGSMRRMIATAGLSPIEVGGHSGGLFRDVPWLSQRFRHSGASRPYRWLERALSSLFGASVHAVARQDVTL